MCEGGRLLADFEAGGSAQPEVPEVVAGCLTLTVAGNWVVWAHKVAVAAGNEFMPLTGGSPYPADAAAECRRGGGHEAPEPGCTCGFHALATRRSSRGERWETIPWGGGRLNLDVALSGRVLAFEWQPDAILFRAARQTVVKVTDPTPRRRPPDDPEGRLAHAASGFPRGSGPRRLDLPLATVAAIVAVADDAGFCAPAPRTAGTAQPVRARNRVLALV